MNITTHLDLELKKAGIPIDGVAKLDDGFRIDFRPEATAKQKRDAEKIASEIKEPAEKTLEQIKEEIKALDSSQKEDVLVLAAAKLILKGELNEVSSVLRYE